MLLNKGTKLNHQDYLSTVMTLNFNDSTILFSNLCWKKFRLFIKINWGLNFLFWMAKANKVTFINCWIEIWSFLIERQSRFFFCSDRKRLTSQILLNYWIEICLFFFFFFFLWEIILNKKLERFTGKSRLPLQRIILVGYSIIISSLFRDSIIFSSTLCRKNSSLLTIYFNGFEVCSMKLESLGIK